MQWVNITRTFRFATAVAVSAILMCSALQAEEQADTHPWSISLSAGQVNYEGDEPIEDALTVGLHAGYDSSELLTVEASLFLAPDLTGNERRDWRTGEQVSRLEEEAGAGISDTWGLSAAIDLLWHLSPWERVDPFLATGVGLTWYADTIGDEIEPVLRGGGGLMYHLNDEWALRGDARVLIAGSDTEFNGVFTAGIVWRPGLRKPAAAVVATTTDPGPTDADKDGLPDKVEQRLGTDPHKADTDRDGLTDQAEVRVHKTDPLNPDTDYDALKDGEEVEIHKTNPRKRDTDGGKVADGHEVIEDGTDPLKGDDDLLLFELRMQFDEGAWEVKPEYGFELNAIGKILQDHAESTARLEGHIDQKVSPKARTANKLTERRAGAVASYFEDNWKIDAKRMKAVGYGFKRPKAASDPATGNPENSRIEIYIRGIDEAADTTPAPNPADK